MQIFSSKSSADSLTHAFSSLDQATSYSNIFCNKLPNYSLNPKPLVGFPISGADMTADVSSVLRQSSSPALSAMGTTTAFNSIQGALGLPGAVEAYETSEKLHDSVGKWLSVSDITMRVSQIFGGTGFTLVRFSDVASGFNQMKYLAMPASVALMVSLQCFGMLYVSIAALSSIKLHESISFSHRLQKAMKNEDELKLLMGDLLGKGNIPPSKSLSEKDVWNHLGMELRSLLNEIDPKLAKKLSDKTLGKALLENESYKKHLHTVLSRMGVDGSSTLEDLKTKPALIQFVWHKENQKIHSRIVGAKGMELIEKAKAMGIYDLLQKADTKEYAQSSAQKLLGDLKTAAEEQRPIMIAYLISSVFGAVFTGLGFAVQSPMIVAATALGFLVCFLTMTYADGLAFWESYKAGGAAGEYSKTYLALHLTIGVLAISAAIAVTVFTGGLAPVAVIVAVGAMWIAMDIWMYFFISKQEANEKIERPTMKQFMEDLKKEGMDIDALIQMFHKLPKTQRQAILAWIEENKPKKELFPLGDQGYSFPLISMLLDSLRSPPVSTNTEELKTRDKLLSEEEMRLAYQECLDKKLIERAFKIANEKLLTQEKLFDKEGLDKHPCKSLFYQVFYNELAKEEQAIYLEENIETLKKNAEILLKKLNSSEKAT